MLTSLQDGAGLISYAENRSKGLGFSVEIDHADSNNASPSRGTACTADTLLPMHGQLVQVRIRISNQHPACVRECRREGVEAPLEAPHKSRQHAWPLTDQQMH